MTRSPARTVRALAPLIAALSVGACVGSFDASSTPPPAQTTRSDAGQPGADAAADSGQSANDAGATSGSDAGSSGSDAGLGSGLPDAGTTDSGSAASDAGAADAGSAASDAGANADAGSGATDAGVLGMNDAGTFAPILVSVAVGKVKNLLVGLPPTNDEVAQVSADPTALQGLITQWMALPQYNAKMLSFFATAFQQTQMLSDDFASEGIQDTSDNRVLQEFQESFARTVLELIAEGQPFTEAMTTRRFMITPRLANIFAFVDAIRMDDNGNTSPIARAPTTLTLEYSQGPIPLAESLDPTSPNYMVWYDPNLATAYDPNCPTDPVVFSATANQSTDVSGYLDSMILLGQTSQTVVNYPAGTLLGAGTGSAGTVAAAAGTATCTPPAPPALFAGTDYTQWQMVNIRKPQTGELTTNFWDVPTFRSGADLVLNTPRVGFFTTPAFFAGWQTNNSNVARVTLNQTMIVALGKAMSPDNTTSPPSLAALDQAHAAPGSACYSCHQSLDPLRQFFRHDYSLSFGVQANPLQLSMEGQFAYWGVSASGTSIYDLGTLLAGHPMFAANWVQQLCTYANSSPCDPERSGVPAHRLRLPRQQLLVEHAGARALLLAHRHPARRHPDHRGARRDLPHRAARAPLRGALGAAGNQRRLRTLGHHQRARRPAGGADHRHCAAVRSIRARLGDSGARQQPLAGAAHRPREPLRRGGRTAHRRRLEQPLLEQQLHRGDRRLRP